MWGCSGGASGKCEPEKWKVACTAFEIGSDSGSYMLLKAKFLGCRDPR